MIKLRGVVIVIQSALPSQASSQSLLLAPIVSRAGAFELLKGAAKLRGIKIRILVPIGDNNLVRKRIEQMKDAGINIRTTKHTFQNKLTTLIVDQSLCLTVELKDDSKETSNEAIGLATYSNSEARVFSYVSIFENLWIQTQLHKKQGQEAAAS